jgi:hypothetical protein
MAIPQVQAQQVGVSGCIQSPAIAAGAEWTALGKFAPPTATPPVPDGLHGHAADQGVLTVEDVQSGQEKSEINGGT